MSERVPFEPFDPAGGFPALGDDEIQFWCTDLVASQAEVERAAGWLSRDERERADRLAIPDRRRRFVIARGVLRRLLGEIVRREPGDVRFTYSDAGKPSVVDAGPLELGVSHSGNLGLFAFSRRHPLGVDLERLQPVQHLETIAERFLADSEREELAALPPDRRCEAFLACWTRKEACIKLLGGRLFRDIRRFRVPVRPTTAARAEWLEEAADGHPEIFLTDLEPAPGYVAALASPRADPAIEARHWSVPLRR